MNSLSESDRPTMPLDTVDFTSFLVEAKRNAQQSTHVNTIREILPSALYMEYTRGLYSYKNIYCGFERFSGQETVYYDGHAIWGMGCTGSLVNHFMWNLQPQWIYAVLRSALSQVSEEMPFRGPLRYEYYGFEYINH